MRTGWSARASGRLVRLATLVVVTGCTASPGMITVPVPVLTSTPVSTAPVSTAPVSTGPVSSGPVPSTPVWSTSVGSTFVGAAGPALTRLRRLAVKGRAPLTGYQRSAFGQTWSDDVTVPGGHNGCDTRNDVLRRDLLHRALKPGTHGCVVAAGELDDPYTGRIIAFVRGDNTSTAVQIDHVVALGDSWQTGAQQLTAAERQDLANDPLELLAVDGPTNQSKGDSNAASWLPPAKAFRCAYVARQIAVKTRYRLWVIPAERDAMERVLASCPGQLLPSGSETATPAPTR